MAQPSHTGDPAPLGHGTMPVHTALSAFPRPFLGPRLRWTKRGLDRDMLCPRSQGDHGSRHRASHPLQHSTKLPCAQTWTSGSPSPPSASRGPQAQHGRTWHHRLESGLQPLSHSRLPADDKRSPSLLPPLPAPLSGTGFVSGGGLGKPPPAPCGCQAAWTLTPAPARPGWHSCTQGARAERQRELSTCPALLSALRSGAGLGGPPLGAPGALGPPGAGLPTRLAP